MAIKPPFIDDPDFLSQPESEQDSMIQKWQGSQNPIQQGVQNGMDLLKQGGINTLQSENESIKRLGHLLHETWVQKKTLSDSISTPHIDEIYEAGLAAGATGGKLLGAGGGGFVLFVVPPENRQKVKEKLKNLVHVDFNFESDGSKIVMYDPQL